MSGPDLFAVIFAVEFIGVALTCLVLFGFCLGPDDASGSFAFGAVVFWPIFWATVLLRSLFAVIRWTATGKADW